LYGLEPVSAATVESHAHSDLVLALARFLKPELYVEIGIEQGGTFKLLHEEQTKNGRKALGCDVMQPENPFWQSERLPDAQYGMFSTQFIWLLRDASVGLAFIDANHLVEEVRADLRAMSAKMAVNGILLLHDTYPPDMACEHGNFCGDGWKLIPQLLHDSWFVSEFELVTLPAQYGLTIMRKHRGRHLAWNPKSEF